MTWLLDGNVLVALTVDTHVHHDRAHRWFGGIKNARFATCAVTQGTLLRVHMKTAADRTAGAAWRTLAHLVAHPAHEWWGDDLSYLGIPHSLLPDSAAVTDAWLAGLARLRAGQVATMDRSFAELHPKEAVLLPR